MTFLELAVWVRSEAGIAGIGPLDVYNNTGELGRVVNWVKDAYVDIQEKRPDWDFLRKDFSFQTESDLALYDGPADLANWRMIDPSEAVSLYKDSPRDENYLTYYPWDDFRSQFVFAEDPDQAPARPQIFTIQPDNKIRLWPVPNDIYTLRGEYYRIPHELVNTNDTPLFKRFHRVIGYNALMRYAAWAEEPLTYANAQKEYNKLIDKLELDQAPGISLGGPIA